RVRVTGNDLRHRILLSGFKVVQDHWKNTSLFIEEVPERFQPVQGSSKYNTIAPFTVRAAYVIPRILIVFVYIRREGKPPVFETKADSHSPLTHKPEVYE